ncbi:unnamed protein product [Calicophoron daubneyi]|uniref:RING-Gid-type domain-containing protein n=1 Tax=Calicophoron daubneyi TaxID=300641 RepID=A0AAV2TBQ0_CALDB
MVSKSDSQESTKITSLQNEVSKVEEKLSEFRKCSDSAFRGLKEQVESLRGLLDRQSEKGNPPTPELRAEISSRAENIKSSLSKIVKVHRDVHPAISKFGKLIDKSFVDDLSTLVSYFIDVDGKHRNRSRDPTKTSSIRSPFAKEGESTKSADELIYLVITEHLLRQSQDQLAESLVHNLGFKSGDVKLDEFRGLSNLISKIQKGDLEPVKKWLSENKEQLGSQAYQLEYTLAKLDFLSTVQNNANDHSAILQCARQLVPFAQTYPSDFEHLMGSLVFLGRNLDGTPYADLVFSQSATTEPMEISPCVSQTNLCDEEMDHLKESPSIPMEESHNSDAAVSGRLKPDGALAQAASLFKKAYCRQMNLSETDPICTVFNSGCRLLSRQQTLQRALSCLGKYCTMDGDTLPIAVELDPAAHRHNIFHCPVIKEVTTGSNGPVRLTCGHVISRDAFESLPSVDRSSKVKCPYCPVETYRNQSLDLIF